MLKLTKTGIGLLTKQYRSVLKKCLLLNLGLFLLFPENASAGDTDACLTYGGTVTYMGYDWNGSTYTVDCYFSEKPSGIETSFMCTKFGCGYYANLGYGVVGPYSSLDTNYGHYVNAPSMYASYPYVKYSTLENFIRLDTEISATNTNLSNLTNELHNYYYTKTEADARYAKLSGGNTFTGSQKIGKNANEVDVILGYDNEGGNVYTYNRDGKRTALITNNNSLEGQFILGKDSSSRAVLTGADAGGNLQLLNSSGIVKTILSDSSFQLNGSLSATGIDFAANVTAGTTNASHLATTGAVNQLLNYYYTFRVDERVEVIDSASFFQKYFLTLQKVDLQSKNPTHLGAFTKCDEVCPRPSERFVSSLSQEQMFKNDASVDAGTSRHCLRQFGDVLADLLKNTAAKSLRISEFMNEEVRHA